MPTLAQKIVIFAAVDGLVLQPLPPRGAPRASAVKIRYRDGAVVRDPHTSGSGSGSASSSFSVGSNAAVRSAVGDGRDDDTGSSPSFEAFGIIGLLRVSHLSFLVSITRRLQVATVLGHPVYVVTDVAVTPCASREDAEASVAETAALLRGRRPSDAEGADADSSDSETDGISSDRAATVTDEVDDVSADGSKEEPAAGSTVARDVIGKQGTYGRFAQQWFSREDWMPGQKRLMGISRPLTAAGFSQPRPPYPLEAAPESSYSVAAPEATPDAAPELSRSDAALETGRDHRLPGQPTTSALLPKLLKTTHMLFGTSRSFFFSFGLDLTQPLAAAPALPSGSGSSDASVPLHLQADPVFFWNRRLLQPFISTNQTAFALPVIQGFVGQRSFAVGRPRPQSRDANLTTPDAPEPNALATQAKPPARPSPSPSSSSSGGYRGLEPLDLPPFEKRFAMTLISRRSTRRAGLRYLRRGIDEDGNAANFVETEQILSAADWAPGSKVYSLVQVRGSIPLFFTQSPYSIRPAPVLHHSSEANLQACKKQFDWLRRRYNRVGVVSLVEKHGIEASIGEEYRRKVERVVAEDLAGMSDTTAAGDVSIPFEWFDFHAVCRGMKFERVSILLDTLRPMLRAFGYSVRIIGSSGGHADPAATAAADTGRQTGVIRTNCMDCLDRTNVCQSSFAKHVLETQLQEEGFGADAHIDGGEMGWFNGLWADNGDAVSKQYAATAAMKGDYTRTRKRDYRGAWNDLGLSLSRFYHGMVNDYFSQAAIDFLLGNVSSHVFEEFEADMMTKDPAVSISRLRELAIDLCRRRVISDDSEDFVGGWVLLSPPAPNSVKTLPLEEVVLMLTNGALYACRFDWVLDKVREFERIDLASVAKVRFGTYVTGTATRAQMDEGTNVGLVVEYVPGRNDVRRRNTRTLTSAEAKTGPSPDAAAAGEAEAETSGSGSSNVKSTTTTTTASPFAGFMVMAGKPKVPPPSVLALKAPYAQQSSMMVATTGKGSGVDPEAVVGAPRQSEAQLVVSICAEIDRLAAKCRLEGVDRSVLEKGEIVSLEEARRSTGLLEQLGRSIKKMIWAS